MARRGPVTVGRLGTPFPLVDAVSRDWDHEPGGPSYYSHHAPEDGAAYLETHRPREIPGVYAEPDRQRTMMVIVPTWFVHPLATPIPKAR